MGISGASGLWNRKYRLIYHPRLRLRPAEVRALTFQEFVQHHAILDKIDEMEHDAEGSK